MASESWMTAKCPDCGEDAEAESHADEDFIEYVCPNDHHFVKPAP